MRFEQMKQGHLRVFITKQELSLHDVRPETLAVGKGQALLRNLLEEAESNYGFQAKQEHSNFSLRSSRMTACSSMYTVKVIYQKR
ncbi:adaptor protein MecA [Exiguobacterium sp. SL14]|nr:adaptor protein MecA [Exiguobacterium sp. SL14]MCY1690660.1 adaptor protein MecA [Exiguobacterium sp. SL14]